VVGQSSDLILERIMRLHPKLIDLSLDRVTDLLKTLSNPEQNIPPVIHVAGTNGKGSTQAIIRSGLEAVGKKVHAYTSPHLVRFHERIVVSGNLISESNLSQILDECYHANCGRPITYFEMTTVAAILAFSRVKADYCVLEVGLGGRLDATNIIGKPKICIITPISLDHQQFLGNTVTEIAFEKAGILKEGCLCVVSRQTNDALKVIKKEAEKVGAELKIFGEHWHVRHENNFLKYEDETQSIKLPAPALFGPHQIDNAGTAITALRYLKTPIDGLTGAMDNVVWPARMQRLKVGKLVEISDGLELWLDGGHNPAAGEALAGVLGMLEIKPTYLICGMLRTKDVLGYMRPLKNLIQELFAVSIPNEPSTLTAQETACFAIRSNIKTSPTNSVEIAVQTIVKRGGNARIIICGSLYLAGSILRDHS
jgi:dihydrofolate synthase/folylpolyglutamate synthase